jgi:hypothetical protein
MVILGGYPHPLDEAQRPELLKMVEVQRTFLSWATQELGSKNGLLYGVSFVLALNGQKSLKHAYRAESPRPVAL